MNRLTDAELEAMAGFTAGPWDACPPGDYSDFDGNSRVICGDDKRIAVAHWDIRDECSNDNARLIAAAPAMYAELLERRAMDAVVREALEEIGENTDLPLYSAAAVMELVEAGNRVTKAFRALGEVEFPREKYNARFECEQSMIALDAALAPYREKTDE